MSDASWPLAVLMHVAICCLVLLSSERHARTFFSAVSFAASRWSFSKWTFLAPAVMFASFAVEFSNRLFARARQASLAEADLAARTHEAMRSPTSLRTSGLGMSSFGRSGFGGDTLLGRPPPGCRCGSPGEVTVGGGLGFTDGSGLGFTVGGGAGFLLVLPLEQVVSLEPHS